MVGEQTNYIWGVIDLVPDTDFPDIRNRTAIHSNNGSCMVIPREGDKVRLYIQLDEKSGLLNEAGRIDKGKATPEHLLEVCCAQWLTCSLTLIVLFHRSPASRCTLIRSLRQILLSGGHYTSVSTLRSLALSSVLSTTMQLDREWLPVSP